MAHRLSPCHEQQDSKANKALDALLNYETVKYSSNEPFEQALRRQLHRLRRLVKSQTSLGPQPPIIARR